MTPSDHPDFYDDLDAAKVEAWRLLGEAATDRRSPMHTVTVATIGLDGRPRARTVVLRKADSTGWRLRFHADRRGEKLREIEADPRVALVGYDPAAKAQVRAEGTATVHVGDDIAEIAWTVSRPMSRVTYTIEPAPGTELDSGGGYTIGGKEDEVSFADFALVEIAVERLDWLYLASDGHRRACFERGGAMTWLTP